MVAHPLNGIPFSNKEEEMMDTGNNMVKSQIPYAG